MNGGITSKASTPGASHAPLTQRIRWLEKELPDAKDQREYAKQRCITAVTEAIGEAMERAGLRRADLARKLGITRAQVTKLMSGAQNMTLRSLSDLLWACEAEVQDLQLTELGVIEVPLDGDSGWVECDAPKVGAVPSSAS